MSSKQGYLPTLDGWRTIAILAVILDHVVAWQFTNAPPRLLQLTHTGADGVSLFFAISGFLICSRLLEEEDATGRISLRGFYIRRMSRILPAAFTYLAIVGLLAVAGFVLVSPWDWWSSVLFFRNYLPSTWISRGWGGESITQLFSVLIITTLLSYSRPEPVRAGVGAAVEFVAVDRAGRAAGAVHEETSR